MEMQSVEIGQDTNYWLIRPGVKGKCYEDFQRDGCVAIGWDRIGKIDKEEQIMSLDELKDLVEIRYRDLLKTISSKKEYRRKISDIATKIYRFTYQVKEGDIIITPGDDSVLIGRVIGDVEIVEGKYASEQDNKQEEFIGELNKTRKVEWLQKIDRERLEPNIKLELRVIHGLSQIASEQVITEINRTIYSYYTYNNSQHSIYKIKSESAIDFEKYAKFISCIHYIYKNIKTADEKLYIKTNINSPGPIELFGGIQIVEKITTIMYATFRAPDMQTNVSKEYQELVKELRNRDGKDEYAEIEFPCGGQV